MRMVIDAIAFQTPRRRAAAPRALWSTLIDALAALDGVDAVVLDRGGLGPVDTTALPFPPQRHSDSARDSILLQQMCDHLAADLFLSTGFTTPLRTPSILLRVADGVAPDEDDAGEEAVALAFARLVCVPADEVSAVRQHVGDRAVALPIATAGETSIVDIATQLQTLAKSVKPAEASFLDRWEGLRRLQAGVDIR